MKTSNSDNRVFKNKFLEKFSKTNAYVVIIVYIILSVCLLAYYSFITDISSIFKTILFISGLIFYSFIEYIVHRYLFHSERIPDKNNLTYRLHHIHHNHPKDKKRLALPLPIGLILASLLYLLFWVILGKYTPFFFPGFIIGYALYLLIHYLIHTKHPPNNILRILWRNHNIHHFKNDNKAFGVTTPFWDVIFKTAP